jgi:hypothetical protein
MRKLFCGLLMLSMLSVATVKGQVNIGSEDNPHLGAIIDMSQVKEKNLGLLLPSVSLSNEANFQLPTSATSTPADAKGMIVYNTNSNMGKGVGIYVWNGNRWIYLKKKLTIS